MNLLSFNQIEEITKNCLEVEEKNARIIFKRFTEKQLKGYNTNEASRTRSVCPAGICFDFFTDSDFIKFKYSVLSRAKDWMYFDIFIDNVLICSMERDPIKEPDGEICYKIPGERGNKNRVTVYFPHLVELTVWEVELSDNACIEEVRTNEKSLLCLGDSITQGMSALHPSSTYPVQFARHYGLNLLNQGVGGYYFNKNSLDEELKFRPDIIFVAYGTNDWGKYKTAQELYESVEEYFKKLVDLYSNAMIYVITPIWRSDIEEEKELGSFETVANVIVDHCKNYPQVKVIDGLTLVPNMPCYFGDASIHPNDEGFLHYTMGLIRNIKKTI